MPHGEKSDEGKVGDVGPIRGMADENETLGDAVSRVGFEPAKVGRKTVSQGKRRESLKRWASKEPDKWSFGALLRIVPRFERSAATGRLRKLG